MNSVLWNDTHAAEMTAKVIQMEEYFTTGKISTNFFELTEEISDVLFWRELERRIADNEVFHAAGTLNLQ